MTPFPSAACDGVIKTWDIKSQACISTIAGRKTGYRGGLARLSNGYIVSGIKNDIEIWHPQPSLQLSINLSFQQSLSTPVKLSLSNGIYWEMSEPCRESLTQAIIALEELCPDLKLHCYPGHSSVRIRGFSPENRAMLLALIQALLAKDLPSEKESMAINPQILLPMPSHHNSLISSSSSSQSSSKNKSTITATITLGSC